MKEQEPSRSKRFTRRAVVLGIMQGAILAALGGRLAYLQVAEGNRYRMLSDKNRINIKILPPSRGEITDRKGVPLAINERNFRVLLTPEQTESSENSLRALQKIIDLSERDISKTLKKVKQSPKFAPIEIRDQLSWHDVAKIEVNLAGLPGISIEVGEMRSYPLGESTAHLIGYVGAVSRSELGEDRVLSLPGFKTGKTGAERAYEQDLRGKAGTAEMEVNVVGREVRTLKKIPSTPGKHITLTIDADLQKFTQDRLSKERSASAVIMDAKTGAIYAMVSSPGFDPNMFAGGISVEDWEKLLSDPAYPLTNKAIAGQYPPGSTFKMITALAALEHGVATRNTSVFCPGHYRYGGDLFHCWSWAGHGRMDVVEALSQSCDVYFYKISTDLGIRNIADMAYRFGLGKKFGFELSEERPGLVPDKSWKMGHFGEVWRPGETIVASIGQGYLQATPMQMATMTARLVNGGRAVEPWMTGYKGLVKGGQDDWPEMNINRRHLDLILRGMNRAVNHKEGTAHEARIEDGSRLMGGKTGTSQVRRITQQERLEGIRNEDLPWRLRHHALFVGYAPLKNPRYVCAVVVEHGGSGSATAAPIARDLLLETQRRAPTNTPVRPPEDVLAKAKADAEKPGEIN